MKPYLFQLPDWLPLAAGRPIFSYGVMLGISFIVGWSLCVHLSRKDGYDAKVASTAMFVIVVASLLGARLLHFFTSPTAHLTLGNFLKFDEGGLVAYGGIVGGLLGPAAYLGWKKYDVWAYFDNCAPGLALGLGITRIGCFLFGCDYGMRTSSSWAIRFPRWEDPEVTSWIKRSAPAYVDHHQGAIDSVATFSEHVHPTQLYESMVGFVAFAICLLWRPVKRFHGQIMLVFLGYYAVLRFLLETMRGDADRGDDIVGVGLSTSQLTSVLMLAAVGFFWFWQRRLGLYAIGGRPAGEESGPKPIRRGRKR